MIVIAGPDGDWDTLADFVDDDSWRGAAMRAYFQRLERNEYSGRPTPPPTSWPGRARDLVKWLFGFDPDHTRGRHGFAGWLHTSVTDVGLGISDFQLIRMLKAALKQANKAGLDRASTTVFRFLKGRITQVLDPNHARTQAESPEGVVLVPLSVDGPKTTIHAERGHAGRDPRPALEPARAAARGQGRASGQAHDLDRHAGHQGALRARRARRAPSASSTSACRVCMARPSVAPARPRPAWAPPSACSSRRRAR